MKAYQTLLKAETFVCGLQKLQKDLEEMQDRCTRSVLREYLQDLAREDAALASILSEPVSKPFPEHGWTGGENKA